MSDVALATMKRWEACIAERDNLLAIIRDLLANYDDERGVIDCRGDPGCLECTAGTTPNNRNTGPCAFHRARAALKATLP